MVEGLWTPDHHTYLNEQTCIQHSKGLRLEVSSKGSGNTTGIFDKCALPNLWKQFLEGLFLFYKKVLRPNALQNA